ncbi:hypothetical protein HanPSC8_Chr13g0553291 [Helianthus annuus]|nr:hypothetical protein HanPSC8_Chr13g0553291 [Helianthus annuus]
MLSGELFLILKMLKPTWLLWRRSSRGRLKHTLVLLFSSWSQLSMMGGAAFANTS